MDWMDGSIDSIRGGSASSAVSFAAETNHALQKEIRIIQEARLTLSRSIQEWQQAKARLREEINALASCNMLFDAEYVAKAQKLGKLERENFDFAHSTVAVTSPRSSTNLSKLDKLEQAVNALEKECFALVPLIGRPETKTALAILSGKTEEVQAKHVDAIESMGLTNQATIMARRRALVKRLDILCNLARTLHAIASNHNGRRQH